MLAWAGKCWWGYFTSSFSWKLVTFWPKRTNNEAKLHWWQWKLVSLFRPTHWKQTLFMLDKPVSLNAGNSISGTIVLRRNPVWRRHMSVTLTWNISGADKCQASLTLYTSFDKISFYVNKYVNVSFRWCPQSGTKTFPMWRWQNLLLQRSRPRTPAISCCRRRRRQAWRKHSEGEATKILSAAMN